MNKKKSSSSTVEQIFMATNRLMAEYGVASLSMHKIAKEANISVGTIYVHFENKEKLLTEFGRYVFLTFSDALEKNVHMSQPFFEQYRIMWRNIWQYFLDDRYNVINMGQYQSLPNFSEMCKSFEKESYWYQFCHLAQQQNILCTLPASVLFTLSLESAINLAFKQLYFNEIISDETLEFIIERTWRSIQY